MPGIALKVAFAEKGKGLDGLSQRIDWAIVGALNEGGRLVFTQVRKGLQRQVTPKNYRTITSRTYPMPASMGSLTYTIVVKGKPIPIKEFPVHRVAAGVEAAPWGLTRTFQRSFQDKSPGGGYIANAWFARRGEPREPIRKLLGPNLAKEMLGQTRGNQTMPRLFDEQCLLLIPPIMLKRLARALGAGA